MAAHDISCVSHWTPAVHATPCAIDLSRFLAAGATTTGAAAGGVATISEFMSWARAFTVLHLHGGQPAHQSYGAHREKRAKSASEKHPTPPHERACCVSVIGLVRRPNGT